jgi:hypothetical protein
MANRPDDADDHPHRQQTGHHQVRPTTVKSK